MKELLFDTTNLSLSEKKHLISKAFVLRKTWYFNYKSESTNPRKMNLDQILDQFDSSAELVVCFKQDSPEMGIIFMRDSKQSVQIELEYLIFQNLVTMSNLKLR